MVHDPSRALPHNVPLCNDLLQSFEKY